MKTKLQLLAAFALLATINEQLSTTFAQGTAFTYQGRLNNGTNPANGSYDLSFTLYNTNGGAFGQQITNTAVAVTSGLFTTILRYPSSGPFTSGQDLLLEIAVRTNGNGSFSTLSPRQPLTPAPQAIYASSAGTAYSLSSSVVSTLNGLQGGVTLTAGTNVSIATVGNTLTISSSGGGGGTNGSFVAKAGDTMTGTLNLPSNGLTIGGNQLVMNSTYLLDLLCPSPNQGVHIARTGKISQLFWGISDGDFGYFDLSGGTVLRGNISQYSSIGNSLAIGTTVPSGRLTVVTTDDTTPMNITGFDTRHALIGTPTSGLALSYSTTLGAGYITALSPLVSWRDLVIQASTLSFNPSGGTTALSVQNDGSVGIGTTVPSARLDVAGSAVIQGNSSVIGNASFAGNLQMGSIFGGSSGEMTIFGSAAGSVRFEIQPGGNVGIGTGAPQGKLEISGAQDALRLTGFNPFLTFYDTGSGNARSRIQGVNGDLKLQTANNISGTDASGFINLKNNNGFVGIGTSTPQGRLDVNGTTYTTVLAITSDRNKKENFAPVSAQDTLAKVAALPISRWNFKGDSAIPHIGPMAQDFYAAFGVGGDDKHIATVDEEGVALAAIQGLNQKLEQQVKANQTKDTEIQDLKHRLERLEKLIPTSANEH